MEEEKVRLWVAILSAALALLGARKHIAKVSSRMWIAVRSRVITRGDIRRDIDARFSQVLQRMEVMEFKLNHAIRASEAKSRAHNDGASAPTAEAGVEGELLWTSSSFQHLLGVNARDLIGASWMSYVVDKDQERVAVAWARAVKERSRWRARFHMRAANEIEYCIEVVARPVYDSVTDLFCGWVWRLWECSDSGHNTTTERRSDYGLPF